MGRTGSFGLMLVVSAILAVTALSLLLLLTSDPEPTTVENAVLALREELAGRAPADTPVPEGVAGPRHCTPMPSTRPPCTR